MKKTKMKQGITLIEIILAIVLIAIILGLTIPKLMKNSQNAEIKQTISTDVKAIVEAAILWKKSAAGANNNFRSIDNTKLDSRLPNNMVVIGKATPTKYRITSAGLRTGNSEVDAANASGIEYFITWQFDTANTANKSGNFSLGADFNNGANDLQWDAKTLAYAKDAFSDAVATVNSITNTKYETSYTSSGSGVTSGTIDCSNTNTLCYGNISVQ